MRKKKPYYTTKTAISISSDILQETNRLAEELEISRSQLVAQALEAYIQSHRNRQIFDQVNAAYADVPDQDEEAIAEIIRSHRKKLGGGQEWK